MVSAGSQPADPLPDQTQITFVSPFGPNRAEHVIKPCAELPDS